MIEHNKFTTKAAMGNIKSVRTRYMTIGVPIAIAVLAFALNYFAPATVSAVLNNICFVTAVQLLGAVSLVIFLLGYWVMAVVLVRQWRATHQEARAVKNDGTLHAPLN